MTQLMPLEVLASIQHAQLRIKCEFTKKDFLEGKVGSFMLPKDFKPEEIESTFQKLVGLLTYLHPPYWPMIFNSTRLAIVPTQVSVL